MVASNQRGWHQGEQLVAVLHHSKMPYRCPLGSKSGHRKFMSALPRKQTLVEGVGMSALCQKQTCHRGSGCPPLRTQWYRYSPILQGGKRCREYQRKSAMARSAIRSLARHL